MIPGLANQFSIQQQVFDLRLTDRALVHELQNRVSRLNNDRLTQEMNRLLEKIIPEDLFLRFDTLVIDAGTVSYENLEQELEVKFLTALQNELMLQVRLVEEKRASARDQLIPEDISGDEQLFEHFLLHGSLPWWRSGAGFSIDEIVQRLFEERPDALHALIIRLGQYEYIRQRMVFQLHADSIKKIVELLEPVEAAFIFGYHRKLVALQEQERVVQAETAVFEKETWLFIITYLLDDRGSEFNRKAFVRSTLQRMAGKFNISYTGLLYLFYEAFRHHERDEPAISSLESIIGDLAIEQSADAAGTEQTANPSQQQDPLTENLALLVHYFRYGSLPAGAASYNREHLFQLFSVLAGKAPDTVRNLLADLSSLAGIAERYIQLTGKEEGGRLLALLYGEPAKLALMLGNVIELLQQRHILPETDTEWYGRMAVQKLFGLARKELSGSAFLQQLLGEIVHRHNRNPEEWIHTLDEGIRSEFPQGIIHSGLPDLIRELATGPVTGLPDSAQSTAENADEQQQQAGLRDLLRFMVDHGYMPWWGRMLAAERNFASVFGQALNAWPQQVAEMIRIWGESPLKQQRVLTWLSPQLWEQLWQLFSFTPSIQDTVADAINRIPAEWGTGAPTINRTIHYAVWQTLVANAYRSFPVPVFYLRLVPQLAAQTGIPETEIVLQLLATAAGKDQRQPPFAAATQALMDLAQQRPAPEKKAGIGLLEDYLHRTFAGHISPAMLPVQTGKRAGRKDSAWQAFFKNISESSKQLMAREMQSVLRYYLTWNRLPEGVGVTAKKDTGILVAGILKFLYAIDATALRIFLNSQGLDADQRRELAKLFNSNKGGAEQLLFHLLTGKTATGKQKQQETVPPENPPPDDAAIAAFAFVAPGGTRPEEISEKLLDAFSYFFTYNRLPEGIVLPDGMDTAQFLKQAFLLLHGQQPGAVRTLLHNRLHIPGARLFFHSLFTEQAGGREKEIAHYLEPYRAAYLEEETRYLDPAPLLTEPMEAVAAESAATRWETLVTRFLLQQDPVPQHDILLEALRYLFFADRARLEALLSARQFSSEQRFRLYHAFFEHSMFEERQLAAWMEARWEKDLQQVLAAEGTIPDDIIIRRLKSMTAKDAGRGTAYYRLFFSSPIVLEKLLARGEQDALLTWLSVSNNGWGKDTLAQITDLETFLTTGLSGRLEKEKFDFAFQRFRLRMLSGQLVIRNLEAYLMALFAFLAEQWPVPDISLFETLQQRVGKDGIGPLPKQLAEPFSQELSRLMLRMRYRQTNADEQRKAMLEAEAGRRAANRKYEELLQEELLQKRMAEEAERRRESQKIQEDKHNKIYIRNAGLVLLHPFLGTYFTRVGLLENGQFRDEAAQQRAVMLLQYLAYGHTQSDEFELPLNKILCGVPVELPVPADIEVSKTEAEVAEELFQVIFQQWDKMKNTSVAGFRASFIQREGSLLRNEDTWELKVEQRSYDLLLSTLPWGISMIRHTWMNQLLTVEWT